MVIVKEKGAGLPGCCPKVSPNTSINTTGEACTFSVQAFPPCWWLMSFETGDLLGHIKQKQTLPFSWYLCYAFMSCVQVCIFIDWSPTNDYWILCKNRHKIWISQTIQGIMRLEKWHFHKACGAFLFGNEQPMAYFCHMKLFQGRCGDMGLSNYPYGIILLSDAYKHFIW